MNGINIDEGTLVGADLGAMTAQLAEANAAAGVPKEVTASATTEQRAAQPEPKTDASSTTTETNQSPKQTDTPAAGDKPAPANPEAAKAADAKTDDAKPGEPAKSKFAQEQERRDKSWKALNEQKETFKQEQDRLKAEREQFQRERELFQKERDEKALESHIPAEKFEAAAKAKTLTAEQLEFQADKAEDSGDADKAKQLRKQAQRARVEAEQYQEAAEQAKKNPPANLEAVKAAREAQVKEWTLKAGIDFPEFAKANSEEGKMAAIFLANLQKTDPDIAKHPKAIYFAAQQASLAFQAARVPALNKVIEGQKSKLSQMEARVKELEALTSPAGGGTVVRQPAEKSFMEMSAQEQAQHLAQQAREMGTFR